jgi:amino acid transporter
MAGIAVASLLGLLGFLAGSSKQSEAFNWMLALSGLSSILTWGSINLAHIRFRKGWHAQGHTLDELAFRSQPGIVGSWIGFLLNVLVLAAQFWTGFAPIGYADMTASEIAINFFQVYLAAPIVIAFYVPFKLYYRTAVVRSHNMDLHSGIRELNLSELIAEERAERATWPMWKRVYKHFC